jgi:hypothetical protein
VIRGQLNVQGAAAQRRSSASSPRALEVADTQYDGGWPAVLGDDDPAVLTFEALDDLGEPVLHVREGHVFVS